MSEVNMDHLSERSRKKLEDEMAGGKRQQARQAEAVEATRKQVEEAGGVPEVSVEELVARRTADNKLAAARIADAQEAALVANAEKEVRDFNEANGHVAATSDKVLEEANRLTDERLAQSAMLEPLSIRGEAQGEAIEANHAKEVADRVEGSLYQGDTEFQGVTHPVDTGPRYDEDGNLIEDASGAPATPEPVINVDTAANIAADQAAEAPAPKKRGRPAKTAPAHPVGDGPKSE